MAAPYTTQTISGYNSSPPADDGSAVSANQLSWAKHKTKLGDPIKTLAEAINTELLAAFGKIAFSGVSDKTTNYTILESDQGNLMTHSGSGNMTFTLLAAATAGSNWAIAFSNIGTGTTTIDGNGAETINGSATITLESNQGAILVCDGSNWSGIVIYGNLHSSNNLSDVADAATAFTNIKQAASTTATGVVELATDAETGAGTDATRAVTPAGLGSVLSGSGYLTSVDQAALDTAQGSVSNSSGSGSYSTLPGGQYGFYPQCSVSGYVAASETKITGAATTSLATRIWLGSTNDGFGSNTTITAYQRYINASPPYDLGDGEIPLFVFVLVDNASRNIDCVYCADCAPWHYNGPTDIRPDFIRGGRKYRRVKRLPRRLTEVADDPVARAELIAAIQQADFVEEEITQAVKQADMAMIPHPWTDNSLTGKTIALLDPVSDLVAQLGDLHAQGENINEILHSGYLRPDNTALQRSGPPGVRVVTTRWRNTA